MAGADLTRDGGAPGSPDQIRNVVIVGPPGAGKTTLFDRLVTARHPGRRPRAEPRPSQALEVASVPSGDLVVNLVDTPGDQDFVGDVRAGLRAADAALFVVPANADLDEATRMLWRECETIRMPRAVAVTKLEQARADFDETVARCQREFGDAQPLRLPLVVDGAVAGDVDLLHWTLLRSTGAAGSAQISQAGLDDLRLDERITALMESIIEQSEDEVLLERHLSGEEIDLETVAQDLQRAIGTAQFFPILATHAPSGLGMEGLYDLIERCFPSPAAAPMPSVFTLDGGQLPPLTCDPHGPLVAEIVQTTTDPFLGRLSLVRVFSGTLTADAPLHVSGHLQRFAHHRTDGHADHDVDERVGPLASPLAGGTRPKTAAIAGDLVLVSKLSAAETSDTLSARTRPALIEPWLLPEPLLPVALRAATRAEEEKLASALQRLVAEDVTMRLAQDAETHQTVVWAMGPAHVEKLLKTLRETWHVQVEVEAVRTSFRETFVRPTVAQGRLVKQSGGHGQYAVCRLEIEPLERGAGIEFGERVVGGAVPRQFIPSVEKGVRSQLGKGVLAGYPVVDVRVTLVDGKAHSVDSSDMAFQNAAAAALRDAANATTVSLLEPIDAVDITVGEDWVGPTLVDLRSRRGQVHGTETSAIAGHALIHAEVPAQELSRYAIDLRSVSRGTGSFTRRFARYDYMPTALAQQLLS